MAKAKLHSLVKELRGTVGDEVFRRYGDRTIVSKKPERSEIPPSEAQLGRRERFGVAAKYAGRICEDPELRAPYDEVWRLTGQPVSSLMTGDFLNAPVVEEVDISAYGGVPGDVIRVAATDDFEVIGVSVVLMDVRGGVIEEGPAAIAWDGGWVYTTTASVPSGTALRIAATATDRPGNAHTLEEETTL